MSKIEVEDVAHCFEKGKFDEPGCHHPAAFRGFSQDRRSTQHAIRNPLPLTSAPWAGIAEVVVRCGWSLSVRKGNSSRLLLSYPPEPESLPQRARWRFRPGYWGGAGPCSDPFLFGKCCRCTVSADQGSAENSAKVSACPPPNTPLRPLRSLRESSLSGLRVHSTPNHPALRFRFRFRFRLRLLQLRHLRITLPGEGLIARV